jgi:hypothetical protein
VVVLETADMKLSLSKLVVVINKKMVKRAISQLNLNKRPKLCPQTHFMFIHKS